MKIELIYLKAVNVAMWQNRIPIIRELRLTNTGETARENITVNVSAEPAFAQRETLRIDSIAPGESRFIDSPELPLDRSFLTLLTERDRGEILVSANAADEEPVARKFPLEILPYDQWSGINILPELLSAFVTPNHSCIAPILRRATHWMREWSGNSALDGYQSRDPNRARLQMAAIYTALAEQNLAYVSTPPDFGLPGQRVRLADNVLGNKLGNCLDMTLLYCGCIEAAGLHPLVVMQKEHAFAGAWLVPDTFPDAVNDDIAAITKRNADGVNEILILETTALCNQAQFDEAVKLGASNLLDSGIFLETLDVTRSRRSGVRPLPQKTSAPDSETRSEDTDADGEEAVTAPASITPYDLPQTTQTAEMTKQMVWERKLLDLSLRNNLLNTRITANSLQIISVNLHLLEDALADGAEFRILPKPAEWTAPAREHGIHPGVDPADPVEELLKTELDARRLRSYLAEEQLARTLTGIYRSSRLSIEESGSNTLYLALGFFKWYETPGSVRPRYAPLLLLPVEIIRKSAARGYVVRSRDEEPLLNITLFEMLRQNYNLVLHGLEPLPRDESGVDVRKIFALVRHAIKEQKRWDVVEIAVLGLFSFSTFVMWNDIHTHADILAQSPVVASLMSGQIEWRAEELRGDAAKIDKEYEPGDILLPMPADSSQLEAIYEALQGASFVLHGPPGTGKSQTITNIIANALYRGKRVLFVAEKMAALEVVERRLREIGLAPFCLELHSHKVRKAEVLGQLQETTEIVRHQSPEDFAQVARNLSRTRAELNAYVKSLHEKHSAGFSLHEAIPRYLEMDAGIAEFGLPGEILPSLDAETLSRWREGVESMARVCRACGHPANHPLEGVEISDYNRHIQETAYNALSEWRERLVAAAPLSAELDALTGFETPATRGALGSAAKVASALRELPDIAPAESIWTLDAAALLKEWRDAGSKSLLPRILERTRLRLALKKHLPIPPRKWRTAELLAALANLQKALAAHIRDIPQLSAARRNLAAHFSEGTAAFKQVHGQTLEAIIDGRDGLVAAGGALVQALRLKTAEADDFTDAIDAADRRLRNLNKLADWSLWITERDKLNSLGASFVVEAFLESEIPPDELCIAFEKSLYISVINYLIDSDPALNRFKGEIFSDTVAKFKELSLRFRMLSRQEIRARLYAGIPSFTQEAATSSEVGILQRNIRNRGYRTSIRALFDQIPTLLPRICPCMLMSPMSVAQYLAADAEPFDMVIFDEASQITTGHAVGALARGRSAIVVGDPRQLPPTSFFTTRSAEEENVALEDMESVLEECLALSMPSKHLVWHYRSRHESLIAFSNAEYYDNRLHTFPSPDNRGNKVAYVQVEGVYDKGGTRTNRAEAVKIVTEIERRLDDSRLRENSIGVVTFSSAQQNLVEDLLNELYIRRPELETIATEHREPIFVKNLENVQGDERDVILFSICYGPDTDGRVSMNFGPINREGGERRLNVAVSRSRREMMVFSTLKPDQIDLNRTAARGVAGLKKFLEFARDRTFSIPYSAIPADNGPKLTEFIADALRRRGYAVDTNVGSSAFKVDLAIVDPQDPERYSLGVIYDGDTYLKAATANDRELVQPDVLAGLGWRTQRIWTVDWAENPHKVLDSIRDALSETGPAAQAVSQVPDLPTPPPIVHIKENVMRRKKPSNPRDIPPAEIATVLREHLELQMSVPEQDLLRLAARTFGYARLGTNVEQAMRDGLRYALERDFIKTKDGRVIFHDN